MASGSQGVIYEGKDVGVNFITGVRGMTGFWISKSGSKACADRNLDLEVEEGVLEAVHVGGKRGWGLRVQ
jgi:hypothetical protein